MRFRVIGCSYRSTPIELRERLAFDGAQLDAALEDLNCRYGCEAVILSTCNRVEFYLGRTDDVDPPDIGLIGEFISEYAKTDVETMTPHFYHFERSDAVCHLFRVACSLDSMVVGEAQIAGQVKRAYELANAHDTAGALSHALFQRAHSVAKRVHNETGITRGHVSVSSVAVDFVRQVFDHFNDKNVLVIGAGKMGELTLRHLAELKPQRIAVTNRSPDKAQEVAQGCNGEAVPWARLDDALREADIVLSTTGANELIMPRRRFDAILARRTGGPIVILDIAVPRDFDPRIHDGDQAFLFNIDDLQRIREQTLQERRKHIAAAEAIIAQEEKRFTIDWSQRKKGPIISQLTQEFESRRKVIIDQLFKRLNGRLTDDDRKYIEGAFRLLQNQFLHGPLSALSEESLEMPRHTLLDALRKLFRLEE